MSFTTTTSVSVKSNAAVKVAAVCLWVVLTALSAQMKIWLPFTPVPITLQSGVVLLGGVILGKYGFAAQVLYVFLGGVGLPIFAVDLPGVKAIWGPTGGYLFGFMISSYLTYRFVYHSWKNISFWGRFSRLLLISLTIFIPGVPVLKTVLGISWSRALELGLYPFIIGDILKTLLVSLTPTALIKKSQSIF